MCRLRLVAGLLTIGFLAIGYSMGGCGSSGGGSRSSSSSADTTAPELLSVSPADGATEVASDSTVVVVFSEAMDASSITIGTFSVSAEGSGDSSNLGLSGSISYDATANAATFTPASNLSSATTYAITVMSEVKDAAGNPMAADFTASFQTIASSGGTDEESEGEFAGTAASSLETLCSGLVGSVGDLVADSDAVYFVLQAMDTTTDPGGQICRCPLAGGTANCFYESASCNIVRISLDSNRVYFVLAYSCDSNPKQVFACPLASTTGSCSPTTIASQNNATFVNGLPSDGTYLYYGDGTTNVNRIRIATGGISQVCSVAQGNPPISVGIDSTTVYFQTGSAEAGNYAIRSCPKDASGSPTLLTAVSSIVSEFVASGSTLYYREISSDETTSAVKSVATSGGSPTTFASGLGSVANDHTVAVSGDSVYLAGGAAAVPESFGQLLKLAKDGSSSEILVDNEPVNSLAVVGDSVYFGGTEDSDADLDPAAILRVPK